jgi:probable phosphoglycerate mutase
MSTLQTKPVNVYFVRHGETTRNAARVHQASDTTLSERGIAQAKVVAKRFSRIPIDLIVSSTHKRARQTAEIIAEAIQKPVKYSSFFVERKRPREIEGKHTEDPHTVRVKKLIQDHYHQHAWRYADEENFSDLKQRALKAVHYLEKIDTGNILVVSHGTFVKAVMSAMAFGPALKSAEEQALQHFMRVDNSGISVCTFTREKWQLLSWNDRAHLG